LRHAKYGFLIVGKWIEQDHNSQSHVKKASHIKVERERENSKMESSSKTSARSTSKGTTANKRRPQPRKLKNIPINVIPEGFRIRRKFDDGNFYIARVMSELKWLFDVDKDKQVLNRQVKYYADEQEEWLDEEELNKWAYSPEDSDEDDEEEDEEDASTAKTKRKKHTRDDDDDYDESNNDNEVDKPETQSKKRPATSAVVSPSLSSKRTTSGESSGRILFENQKSRAPPDAAQAAGKRKKESSSESNSNLPSSSAVGVVKKTKIEARNVLKYKMGITEEEIDSILDQMSSPFNLNEAINNIHKERRTKYDNMISNNNNNNNNNNGKGGGIEEENFHDDDSTLFEPKIGMKVRIPMAGSNYYGKIMSGPKTRKSTDKGGNTVMWTVKFDDDGTKEDYDWNDLCRFRASRPIINLNNRGPRGRGRYLCSLELFCGQGIITQEFCERKWLVKSIDSDPKSYATNVIDIMKATYDDIGYVPDFIWASPPCQTCSNLGGGMHRCASSCEFEKTQEAHDHNYLFTQMMYIIKWAKAKNPHLIVVIENPQGQMAKMPLMIEFMRSFSLYKSTIDYCTFDRCDKKPTNLWTNVSFFFLFIIQFRFSFLFVFDHRYFHLANNTYHLFFLLWYILSCQFQDFYLHSRLNEFRCSEGKCPHFGGVHPIGKSERDNDNE
jgi:hypothetical protein